MWKIRTGVPSLQEQRNKNHKSYRFYQKVVEAENRGDSIEELRELLGRGRAKRGMFEGNLQEGELEIGQVSSMINEIKPVKEIIDEIISDFKIEKEIISKIKF